MKIGIICIREIIEKKTPHRGIEPRSPAWQAGILTTILTRIMNNFFWFWNYVVLWISFYTLKKCGSCDGVRKEFLEVLYSNIDYHIRRQIEIGTFFVLFCFDNVCAKNHQIQWRDGFFALHLKEMGFREKSSPENQCFSFIMSFWNPLCFGKY